MFDFFQYDTDEQRKSLLGRARKVALLALQQFDLEWERILFIQLSDSITYKIEISKEQCFLLRIHSDRWSKEEIGSELAWLRALNQSEYLHVPEAVASCSGSYVLEIPAEEGYRSSFVTIMRWIEGEHASRGFTDSCVYNMGVMMGRLHEAAACFAPPPEFVRPTWDADSFTNELAKLERYYPRFLSEEAWEAYGAAVGKIRSELAKMQLNDRNYGLVHADLHTGNMVFRGDQPFPIDFGRCGYGYYLYDLAGTLVGLYPKHRGKFIKGYESIRVLETGYVRDLECFFIMSMIENYCHHASDPRETASLIDEQPYAQACIRDYLNDISFLFDVIEPVAIDRPI